MAPFFLGTLPGWPEYGLLQRALHCAGDSRFGRRRAASVQSQRKLGHKRSATRYSRRSRFERSFLLITSHAQFKMPPVVGKCVRPSVATCICTSPLINEKGFENFSLRHSCCYRHIELSCTSLKLIWIPRFQAFGYLRSIQDIT